MAEYNGMEPRSSIDDMPSIKCRVDSPEIPTLVQMYRALIVRCVKADDIVHHLEEVISTREKEEIIETLKQKGSTSAMDELIDMIDGSAKDKKWSIFFEIIDKQGYRYIAEALKGKKVLEDAYYKYKKVLMKNKMHLIEKLNPEELLPSLKSEGIIDQKDVENIQSEQANKGPMAATIVLLDRIWRKKENWFTSFLTVLINMEYSYIVEKIDPTFFEEWENKQKEMKSASKSKQTCVTETPVPITKESKPVQCSDAVECTFQETTLKYSPKVLSESYFENSDSTDFGPKLDPNELFSKESDSETVLYSRHDLHDSGNPPDANDKETNLKGNFSSENNSAKSVDNKQSPNMDGEETSLKIASQVISEEKASNTSLEGEEVVLETFEERKYQTELARPAIQSKNCIIIAPTGSGKTIVAVKIIKHHLEVNRQGRVKKIAFVVEQNNLADQQAKVIKRFVACRLKIVSGDSMRNDFTDLSILLSEFDVFVITAQMLINAMESQQLSITSFSLVIFDECHHCYGGHPFYKTLIPYHDLKQDEENKHILPQIVGFTASIGIGKGDAIEHIRTIMANLDADELVSVKENIAELEDKINSPDQSILRVQNRKVDEFGAIIKTLMVDTEKCLKTAEYQIEDKDGVTPPNSKGNEEYTQWLQNFLREAVAKVTDTNLSRSLSTVKDYLEIYNKGLILYSNARALDALRFITEKIGALPRISTTEIEKQANFLYKKAKSHLENSAADGQRSEENPLLLKLKQILIDTYKEESDMRGIVFVRTRLLAEIIADWMSETDDLKLIKARKCTGAGAQVTEGGTTKNKQKETIDLFRKGNYKVIVATTIAEEGIDVKECNLVVRYNYAGNIISQIQAKGRGRANNSRFFVLASEENCIAERERTISTLKEPMMREAIETIQKEILTNNEAFQCEKQTLQRSAKNERKLVASRLNQSTQETSQSHCDIRCMKCKEYLCPSREIRKIGSQYACISDNLKNKVIFEKGDRTKRISKDITIGHGRFKCNKCEKSLGNVCLYREIHFPLPNIKSIKIDSEDGLKRGEFLNKWKTVEELYFTPSLLTEKDLEKIAETGKLVDFK